MELIDYSVFGSLRLKPFCRDGVLYDESEDELGRFIREEVRGIWFARLLSDPAELYVITMNIDDCSAEIATVVFSWIGLRLEEGLSPAAVEERFGYAAEAETREPRTMRFRTIGECPYWVYCSFGPERTLRGVAVQRLDLDIGAKPDLI